MSTPDDKETVRRIFAKPDPGSTEEMIAEHNYATRDVSRAEFEAQTFRIDAILDALRKLHGPGCLRGDEAHAWSGGCCVIRELESKLGIT